MKTETPQDCWLPSPMVWPTWLVPDHEEHPGLALIPWWLQGDRGSQAGDVRGPPSLHPLWPSVASPHLGGSGWAASVPAGRTAPPAASPWGTEAPAASGSPGLVPADPDTGGPAGQRVGQCWAGLLCDIHCLFFCSSTLSCFLGISSPPHCKFTRTRLRPGLAHSGWLS